MTSTTLSNGTAKVTANDPRVISFFNHYHAKVKKNPSLYTNKRDGSNAFVITLPASLIDFTERGAGHSGFGSSARPVGIRRVVQNSKVALANVFHSTDSLAALINSSACDGHEYIAEVKIRHAGQAPARKSVKVTDDVTIDNRPAKDFIVAKHGFPLIKELITKFGRAVVQTAHDTLTVNEYELRFGI